MGQVSAHCRTCGQDASNHDKSRCRLFPGAPTPDEAATKRLEQDARAQRLAELRDAVVKEVAQMESLFDAHGRTLDFLEACKAAIVKYRDLHREQAAEARAEFDSMRADLRRLFAYERAWLRWRAAMAAGRGAKHGDHDAEDDMDRILAEEDVMAVLEPCKETAGAKAELRRLRAYERAWNRLAGYDVFEASFMPSILAEELAREEER
jgi:hypothetical protein